MDAKSIRNMWSIIAFTNKHTAKLHHIGSLYILFSNNLNRKLITINISVKRTLNNIITIQITLKNNLNAR